MHNMLLNKLCTLYLFFSIYTFEKFLGQNVSYLTPNDFAAAKLLKNSNITDFIQPEFKTNKSSILNEKFFEGDMLGINMTKIRQKQNEFEFMSAREAENQKWPSGLVPYKIDTKFTQKFRSVLAMAMEEIQSISCIKFVPSEEYKGEDWVKPVFIEKSTTGSCAATIGTNTPEEPKMWFDERNCAIKRVLVHELIHVLGFCHEQSREDRDTFVTIDYQRVKKGSEPNFEKYTINDGYRPLTPYDYYSIMHYPSNAFSTDKSMSTIVPTKSNVKLMVDHEQDQMSRFDIIKINKHYKCGENLKGCKDLLGDKVCITTGLGAAPNGEMDPGKAKCLDENWSVKNCVKTCGDCYKKFK